MRKTSRPLRYTASVGVLLALGLLPGLFLRPAFAQEPVTPQPAGPTTTIPATVAPTTMPLRLVYGGKALTPSVAPWRDPADNAICIPVEALEPLGIVSQYDVGQNRVALTTLDGSAATVVLSRTPPPSVIIGEYRGVFVAAETVVTLLGGKCEFESATNTLYLRSVLKGVELDGDKVRVKTSLPVVPRVTRGDSGKLLIIDLPGTEFGNLPKPTLTLPNLKDTRVGQFESDTARVVLEFTAPTLYSTESDRPASLIVLAPGPRKTVPAAAKPTPPKPIAKAPSKPIPHPNTTPSAPATVKTIEFYSVSPQRAQFVIKANRTPQVSVYQAKGRFSLNLNNVTLGPAAGATLNTVRHAFLEDVPVLRGEGKTARLVLDLNRIVNYSVIPDGQGNIVLDIALPRSAGGKLAGKLVVVDAGHGGVDKGAPGVNGTYEKDINLAISFQVVAQLKAAGANVVMSRSTDFKVPLYDRPNMANQMKADFFISIHCNDPGNGNRSINGSVVYYHGNEPSCRNLAQCIAERFEAMGGIRSKGIASDYSIYRGEGFAVLRASRMVGVLVETGYMTNPNDVRLLSDPAMQKRIAMAIVGGLQDYIEGYPSQKPEAATVSEEDGLTLPLDTTPVPAVGVPSVPMPDVPTIPDKR